jgi:hypothetical protein
MERAPLDIYDDMPSAMRKYISNYGWHFNKKACEYAVKQMKRENNKGDKVSIEPYTKDNVEDILTKYGVHLENDTLYDSVFVANMCKADYLGSSISDEMHLARYVKDTIDDVDASPETTFRRWVATCIGNGQPISWEDMI